MKPVFILMLLSLIACKQKGATTALSTKVHELERRVILLEQRSSPVTNDHRPFDLSDSVTGSHSYSTGKNLVSQPRAGARRLNLGRCKGTTKKNGQCKRSAGLGGYCWQHGG